MRLRLGPRTCALLLAYAATTGSAQELPIAVTRTPLSLPLFVADAQRYFADEGVAVRTRECGTIDYDYRLSLDQALLSTLEGQARWALREGHAPRGSVIPNYLQFIAAEPLRRVAPAAVTLVE